MAQHSSVGGFSLVELVVATGLTLIVMASVFALVGPAHGGFHTQTEAADLEQRLRVGVDTLARELRRSGAGPSQGHPSVAGLGPLSGSVPSVLPYRLGRRRPDLPGTFKRDTITIIHVAPGAVQSTTAQALPAQASTIQVRVDPGCPLGDLACGFRAGMMAMVLGQGGAFDLFTVSSVQGPAVTLQHNSPDSTLIYPPVSTRIVEATSRTYYLKADPVAGAFQLVRYDGASGADVPVVDHVVGLSFEYLGDPQPPRMRKPLSSPTGPWTTYGPTPPPPDMQTSGYPAGENCVFTSDGVTPSARLAVLGDGTSSLVRLDDSQLSDGPWCPDAVSPNRFDADLLRVRSVAVTLRVESAAAALRGPAGPLFTRGGTSRGGQHFLPDQEARFQIAPPNLHGGR